MKKILLLITILALTNLISANLILEPNPISIQTKIGNISTHNITLTNTHPFKLLNFQFSNLTGFTFPNITLESNQTKTFSFTVQQTELKSESIQSTVSFKYLVDIPSSPETHNIDLTQWGFVPNFLTIHQGDTVIWHNKDTISNGIIGSFYELQLAVNGTTQQVFNTIGTEIYQSSFLFWGGTIEVLSRDEPQEVNNPNNNKILRVDLNVIADPTTLSINFPIG